MIPWNEVVEIHLSGIIKGKDKTLHDGHSDSIPKDVWDFLNTIINLKLLNENTYINIEHSDISWKNKNKSYYKDFKKLKNIINKLNNDNLLNNYLDEPNIKAIDYAKGHIKKLLNNQILNVDEIEKLTNLKINQIYDIWFDYVDSNDQRLALSRDEIDTSISKNTIYYIDSFINFIRQNNGNRN